MGKLQEQKMSSSDKLLINIVELFARNFANLQCFNYFGGKLISVHNFVIKIIQVHKMQLFVLNCIPLIIWKLAVLRIRIYKFSLVNFSVHCSGLQFKCVVT